MILDNANSKAVDFSVIWSSSPDSMKYQSHFSLPELIEFPTEFSGKKAYAYFYSPSNPTFQASGEEKPPLLLKSHGMSWLFSFLIEALFQYLLAYWSEFQFASWNLVCFSSLLCVWLTGFAVGVLKIEIH